MQDGPIAAIKERLDLFTEATQRLGPPARISGGIAKWRCPRHDERTPSFGVNLTGEHAGRWRCWGACAVGGDVLDFIAWLDNCSVSTAIDRLKGVSPHPPAKASTRHLPAPRTPSQAIAPPKGPLPPLEPWLDTRGWELEVVQDIGLSVVADWRGGHRVRFPFIRVQGEEPVFWQDRTMGDFSPKWMAPRGQVPCPFEAWRMNLARNQRMVYICEGLPDVVAILHYWPDAPVVGVPGVSAFKPHWARAFRGLSKIVVIADNDDAGKAMRRHIRTTLDPVALRPDILHLMVPDDFKDVDEWRQGDDHFPDHFLAALEDAQRRTDARRRANTRGTGAPVGCAQPGGEGTAPSAATAASNGSGPLEHGPPAPSVGGAGSADGGTGDPGGEAEAGEVVVGPWDGSGDNSWESGVWGVSL